MLRNITISDLLPVAQIVKSYDTNGDIVAKLSSYILEDYNYKKEPVFIIFDELPVPFFITSFKKKGSNGAIIKFETINDLSHSEELIKKNIYVLASTVNEEDIDKDSDTELANFLIGFKLENQEGKKVGTITDYFNYPNNPCIEVNNKNLIPFNEDLIIKVDSKKRIISMQIPNGLLED